MSFPSLPDRATRTGLLSRKRKPPTGKDGQSDLRNSVHPLRVYHSDGLPWEACNVLSSPNTVERANDPLESRERGSAPFSEPSPRKYSPSSNSSSCSRTKVPPLDPVQPLGRPSISLIPLTAHGQSHGMLPSRQVSNRPVMGDIGAHLSTEVLLDDEGGDGICLRRWGVAGGEFGGGRREGEGSQRGGWTGSGGGGGEERREGVELRFREVGDAQLVVELQAGHDARRGVVVDAVESE